MRLAIISTPRSGNTWVRTVLADLYDLSQVAVHNPADLPAQLPDRVIIQIHWYREPRLQAWLNRNEFRVLVLARHPLDVLLSILKFVRHEPETSRWLEGNAELPAALARACPTSRVFLDYALSWGAENLLGVSYAWWHDSQVLKIRYEELLRNPDVGFERVTSMLGPHTGALSASLHRSRLGVWQATLNHHGWQGQSGLWRSVMTPSVALRIYHRHRRLFQTLGYAVRPYFLTANRAERRWRQLTCGS